MTERGILFSAPMVRALLDDTKTQTRRVCKSQPYSNGFHFDGHDILCHNDYLPPSAMLMDYREGGKTYTTSNMEGWEFCCPYGQPGDRLWVRETYQALWAEGIESASQTDWKTGKGYAVSYPASDGVQEFMDGDDNLRTTCKPSIHMPRWASRILLEIVSVRVERLNDISDQDAIAEGIGLNPSAEGVKLTFPNGETVPHAMYRALWEDINGVGSWAANPWVWVVEFKRVQP